MATRARFRILRLQPREDLGPLGRSVRIVPGASAGPRQTQGWHPAPAFICIPRLASVGLGGDGGQEGAACPRPSPTAGSTPGNPPWGRGSGEVQRSEFTELGVAQQAGGGQGAGRELVPSPSSPRSPCAGTGGPGWDPHPGWAITAAEPSERRRRRDSWTRANRRNPNNIPFLERRNPD